MLKNNFKSSKQARTGAGEKLKLDTFPNTTARPTGQGYGAARTGPSVVKMNRGGPAKNKITPIPMAGGGMPARMRNR
jgi:hypothetical protein|tara:strand:- start:268 stop:498 length:231 start_codon:yes stop_codon:yes gene_type:complete